MVNNKKQEKKQELQQVPPETSPFKVADGQILSDINEALDAVVDMKGQKIDFKRNEDVKDDLVYSGEGSDGKTYSIQLQKKSVIVSVYSTPKPEEVGKISKNNNNNKKLAPKSKPKKEEKKDLDEMVEQLDKPLLDKEDKKE